MLAQRLVSVKGIRERALVAEYWCAVKHLLCAEEHLLETCQKLAREYTEAVDGKDYKEARGLLERIGELSYVSDRIRYYRQILVEGLINVLIERTLKDMGVDIELVGKQEKGMGGGRGEDSEGHSEEVEGEG